MPSHRTRVLLLVLAAAATLGFAVTMAVVALPHIGTWTQPGCDVGFSPDRDGAYCDAWKQGFRQARPFLICALVSLVLTAGAGFAVLQSWRRQRDSSRGYSATQ